MQEAASGLFLFPFLLPDTSPTPLFRPSCPTILLLPRHD